MTYNDIISAVAKELNLSEDLVNKTYKAYWKSIRETIEQLPLKEIEEKEFQELQTNFNIPSLGKLACTNDKFNKLKRRFNYIQNLQDKDA